MGRRKEQLPKDIRLFVEVSPDPATEQPHPPKPDARLIKLVRILARIAARDFIKTEGDRQKAERSPD